MLVAEVVEVVLELKLSGTAALPASPTVAVMPLPVPALALLALRLKPGSVVEPANVQVVLGAPVKPPGSVPVKHHL